MARPKNGTAVLKGVVINNNNKQHKKNTLLVRWTTLRAVFLTHSDAPVEISRRDVSKSHHFLWVALTLLEPHSHMWGQFTLNISSLSPKRDWGPKRVKAPHKNIRGTISGYHPYDCRRFRSGVAWGGGMCVGKKTILPGTTSHLVYRTSGEQHANQYHINGSIYNRES